MTNRAGGEQGRGSTGSSFDRAAQPLSRLMAGDGRRKAARASAQITSECVRSDEPAFKQRFETCPQPPLTELREHQRHIVVVLGDEPAYPQCLIERLAD